MYKLLLADDSVTIQRVIELTFSGEDVQVISVNDGEQAIARIPIEHPDIVLADIGMPKRSGYDVAAFIKGQPDLAHIPVLLLAGAFERVDEARAEQVKCDGVLVKPFEPRHVVARVRELVAGAKGSAARIAADVPRPAERLVPRDVEIAPAAEARSEPQTTSPPETSPFIDSSLDDYFEKLNAAFEDVRKPPPTAGATETTPAAGQSGSDSLDGYFDRLSAAFADLAKPMRDPNAMPPSFDELLSDEPIPTVEALTEDASTPVHVRPPTEPTPDVTHVLDTPAYPPPPLSISSLPTLDRSPHAQTDAPLHLPSTSAADARRDDHEEDVNGIADVLSALLAEQSALDQRAHVPDARTVASLDPIAREALVVEVTRRVLDRLVPEVTARLKRLVADELEKMGTR